MKKNFKQLLVIAALALAGQVSGQASGQVILYEQGGFAGRSLTVVEPLEDFRRSDFNDSAQSLMVIGQPWQLCEDYRFQGHCVVLRPGRYPSLTAMGMDNMISSVRTIRHEAQVADDRYAPAPIAVYDNRRQNDERLYEVGVTSVKAVVGRDEQRCWLEQQPVVQNQGSTSTNANANPNVGGALVGALLGGILGHQVGAGTGKDLATVGGVIAGGVIGSNVGRDANAQAAPAQNIQRCSTASQAAPAYWDVTYSFRGQVHRVQMATQPGATLTVNEQGEPRS
jgi:uncharacterized protein YcfJ